MFSQLTTPLAIALFFSYVGLAMLVTTGVVAPRVSRARVQLLIWATVAVGGLSVLIRTIYFALT